MDTWKESTLNDCSLGLALYIMEHDTRTEYKVEDHKIYFRNKREEDTCNEDNI